VLALGCIPWRFIKVHFIAPFDYKRRHALFCALPGAGQNSTPTLLAMASYLKTAAR
jgi:hypothetical protein